MRRQRSALPGGVLVHDTRFTTQHREKIRGGGGRDGWVLGPEKRPFLMPFLMLHTSPALFFSWLELFCARQFLVEVFLILSPRLSSISYPKFLIFREKVSFSFL